MSDYEKILETIPIEEIQNYIRNVSEKKRNLTIKEHSNDFCFILDDGLEYDEEESVVYITRKSFFDEHGYLEDTSYDIEHDEDATEYPPYLALPNFLYEISESTYSSEYDQETTKKKLIELGFEERFF